MFSYDKGLSKMEIQISLSKTAFALKDRVIVKIKKDEWYLGRVTKVSEKRLAVEFDDGYTANIVPADFKHVLPSIETKSRKKALTDLEAKQKIKPKPLTKVKPPGWCSKPSGLFGRLGWSALEAYLEGHEVPDSWVEETVKRRSSEQKTKLFRLCLVSTRVVTGTTIRVKKSLISASDRRESAIYAGTHYHLDSETDLTSRKLALIQIDNPTVLMSLRDILAETPVSNTMAHTRLKNEREYLIRGPIVGKVLEIIDINKHQK